MAEPAPRPAAFDSDGQMRSLHISGQKLSSALRMGKHRQNWPAPTASRRRRSRGLQQPDSSSAHAQLTGSGNILRSLILIYRKTLSIIANRLKPMNKCIVGFYRRLDRNVVRRSEPNALQELASKILHGIGLCKIDRLCAFVWHNVEDT